MSDIPASTRIWRVFLTLILISAFLISTSACSAAPSLKSTDSSAGTAEGNASESSQADSREAAQLEDSDAAVDAESPAAAAAPGPSEAAMEGAAPRAVTADDAAAASADQGPVATDANGQPLEKAGQLFDVLDEKAPLQEIIPQEDGSFKFQELEVSDVLAWLTAQEDPLFIDFWATWCGPCQMISPEIDKIAADYPDVRVIKANVDFLDPQVLLSFNVQGIPALHLLQGGQPSKLWIGAHPDNISNIRVALDELKK